MLRRTLLFAPVVALYVGARLWRLTESCLWFDELFGVHASRHAWGELWRFVAADLIHPPLFYALLKLWAAAGGESLLWLRLFPVVTACAAVVPFLLLARELRLKEGEALVALLLAAASGFLIKYSQEVRMYSLLLLLALSSLLHFARYLNAARATKGRLFALFVVNLLLVYTHYYGWLVVANEALFLLHRRRERFKPFALTLAAVALCFAPWAYACAAESGAGGGLAQNIGWIERPGPAHLARLFALLHEPFYFQRSSAEPHFTRAGALAGLLIFVPALLLLFRLLTRREGTRGEEEGARATTKVEASAETGGDESLGAAAGGERLRAAVGFLLFFTAGPLAMAFAASLVLPFSVWGERHLIAVAGPYLLLAGVALARLRPFWLKTTVLILLSCWLLLAGASAALRREGVYVWCAWEGLAKSLARDERGPERDGQTGARPAEVYAFEDLVAYHLWFALGDGEAFRVAVVRGWPGVAHDPAYFLPRRFHGVAELDAAALSSETFWVAFRADSLDEARPPLDTLASRGYRVERVYESGARGQRAFLVRLGRDR
jgi:Dolichyl-phosphate-mannose-protein mannosyltransferase